MNENHLGADQMPYPQWMNNRRKPRRAMRLRALRTVLAALFSFFAAVGVGSIFSLDLFTTSCFGFIAIFISMYVDTRIDMYEGVIW